MNLVKTDRDVLSRKSYAKSENQELLEEFINSGLDCAEVTGFTQATSTNCAYSLRASIKRYRIHGIRVTVRKDKVYLLKV